MSNYIDLVLCKHPGSERAYLFKAPTFSHIEPLTDVIVDTRNGRQPAKVICSVTVKEDGEEFNFITKMAGAKLPLKKVLQRVIYMDYTYDEEEENELAY